MTRGRVLRLLRIAASAVCLGAYGMLLLFWVRSYWWSDSAQSRSPGRIFSVTSKGGQLSMGGSWGRDILIRDRALSWHSKPMTIVRIPVPTFGARITFRSVQLDVPHWFIALVLAAVFALVQRGIPYRFSLRTLLLVTTLVAILLGLVVAMT